MNVFINGTFNITYKHTSIFFITLIFFYFGNSPLNAETLTTKHDFESGMKGLRCSGNCPQVSTAQKKSGKYSGNFTLTRNMSTPYRTEAVFGEKGRFAFGKEYWVSFDYRYEDWKKDKSKDFAPFQIHTTQSNWSKECKVTKAAAGSAPFFMVSGDDKVRFATYKNKTLWSGPIQKQQWLKIVVHFKISTGNDGFIEAWKDGVKLGRVNGANSPKFDGCGKLMREPYLKVGIYKWDWKPGRKATGSTRRQLFVDNLKIATGTDGYSLVNAASSQVTKSTKPNKSDAKPAKNTISPKINN
jgi:hypothetical protein